MNMVSPIDTNHKFGLVAAVRQWAFKTPGAHFDVDTSHDGRFCVSLTLLNGKQALQLVRCVDRDASEAVRLAVECFNSERSMAHARMLEETGACWHIPADWTDWLETKDRFGFAEVVPENLSRDVAQ